MVDVRGFTECVPCKADCLPSLLCFPQVGHTRNYTQVLIPPLSHTPSELRPVMPSGVSAESPLSNAEEEGGGEEEHHHNGGAALSHAADRMSEKDGAALLQAPGCACTCSGELSREKKASSCGSDGDCCGGHSASGSAAGSSPNQNHDNGAYSSVCDSDVVVPRQQMQAAAEVARVAELAQRVRPARESRTDGSDLLGTDLYVQICSVGRWSAVGLPISQEMEGREGGSHASKHQKGDRADISPAVPRKDRFFAGKPSEKQAEAGHTACCSSGRGAEACSCGRGVKETGNSKSGSAPVKSHSTARQSFVGTLSAGIRGIGGESGVGERPTGLLVGAVVAVAVLAHMVTRVAITADRTAALTGAITTAVLLFVLCRRAWK